MRLWKFVGVSLIVLISCESKQIQSEQERNWICHDNVAELYGIAV